MLKKELFIYPKDKNGNKTGHTIKVIIKEDMIFYGISLCSEHDQFSYKEGRELAEQRAIEAYERYLDRQAALK